MSEKTEEIRVIEARAQRIRYIREKVLRLKREEFCKRHPISIHSLQNWEQLKKHALTETAAKRLVEAFKKEGVITTIEWLMYGVGDPPPPLFPGSSKHLSDLNTEEEAIAQELKFFHEFYEDAIDTVVNDDSMLPSIWPGDHVAGKRLLGEKIKKAIGLPCILETTSGLTLVRILNMGNTPTSYNLTNANPHSMAKNTSKDVELISAAPIIWIRRRNIKS